MKTTTDGKEDEKEDGRYKPHLHVHSLGMTWIPNSPRLMGEDYGLQCKVAPAHLLGRAVSLDNETWMTRAFQTLATCSWMKETMLASHREHQEGRGSHGSTGHLCSRPP